MLKDWQIEAIEMMLEGEQGNVIDEKRVYLPAEYYGGSRYHIVSETSNGETIIDQTDHGEKYQQRVTLEHRQARGLLGALLMWYLEDVNAEREAKKREAERRERIGAGLEEDPLADIDAHPF